MDYYYRPINWIGAALKVADLYEDKEWLDGPNNRWATAYCGIDFSLNNQNRFDHENVIDGVIKPKKYQPYCYSKCSITGKTCDKGIYLSPFSDVAE